MKRILVIVLSLISMTIAVMADEKKDSLDYYFSRGNTALLDYDNYEAYNNYKHFLRLYKDVFGNISQDTVYAYNENLYADLCYQIGDYETAIVAEKEATEIIKNVFGSEHQNYSIFTSRLALYYASFGDYNEAIRLATEAMIIGKKILGDNHPDYATLLSNLSSYYASNRNYDEAIQFGAEAMTIRKIILGATHPDYAKLLYNLAQSHYSLGNYNEAIHLVSEAVDIYRQNLETDSSSYGASLSDLALYYSAAGNYSEAIKIGTEISSLCEKKLGTNHPSYGTSLSNLALYYYHIGNYNEAIRLGSLALDISKKAFGTEHPNYATSLSNLAQYFYNVGNYDEAIQLGTKALDIRKIVLGVEHPDYAMSLNNLAVYYSSVGNYDEAIRMSTEALQVREKNWGVEHPDYATSLENLAMCYFLFGNHNEAIRLGSEAVELFKNVLGDEHPDYTLSLSNLAYYNSVAHKNDEAVALLKKYMSLVRNNILNTFSGLIANERQMYWNKYSYKISQWIPRILASTRTHDATSILYDNIALFAKGLLLSTELEMTKLIQQSGDKEALQMYSKLRENRQLLNALYSKPIAERGVDCDSLENISSNLERQLVSRVKEFGDYTRNLSINWCDVQNKLGNNDIAIEFLSYQENDSTTAYAALTLCKNDSSPILTHLFTDTDLLFASGDDGTYQTFKADSLVWTPLSSRLEGKSHVYFSASGMLHNIGIEYLPSMEGKECYRLSSTRELVTHQPGQTIGSATLYGDIDYDATYASIETSELSSVSDYAMNTTSDQYRGRFDYRSMRYGVSPLPGTREEIKEVSALLKPLGKPCDAFTGTKASEESFKALSGQRKSLLHISTHGFYYTDEEANNLNDHLQMMLIGDNGPTNYEDQSLLRCGLCFAGANQTLSGESQPSLGQGDGILNALEIAQTDLRGLDLVVLSACQTALGDIAQGEGVFGLQRGFKKAGAQSILMSLWEVDDEITQMFMTEFYRAWTSGQTKTAALKTAQSIIKAKYPDPHHWAAFILLDALE